MTSLSLPHSLPRALPPPRIGAPPSFHRFALFRRSSVNLRASLDSQPSRLSVRIPAAANRSVTAKLQVERFASISSSNNQETSVGVNPQYPVPPPPSNIGSPLFWIGCGVVFSAVFSWVAGKLKGSQNGAAFKQGIDASMSSEATGKVYLDIWIGEAKSPSSEEALEKFLQDPTVQKRVYPYLPEDWRNPTTLKWLFINPQQPQQIHDMLRNMSRSSEWDKRLVDSLENFDPTSPKVKQAFAFEKLLNRESKTPQKGLSVKVERGGSVNVELGGKGKVEVRGPVTVVLSAPSGLENAMAAEAAKEARKAAEEAQKAAAGAAAEQMLLTAAAIHMFLRAKALQRPE